MTCRRLLLRSTLQRGRCKFIANVARFFERVLPYVGTVNASKFYGCLPGTVLFNGITSGALRSATSSAGVRFSYWEMNFSFSAMPNGVVRIDGVNVPKGGWEYLWNLADEQGRIQATYVETVFRATEFRNLGIGELEMGENVPKVQKGDPITASVEYRR